MADGSGRRVMSALASRLVEELRATAAGRRRLLAVECAEALDAAAPELRFDADRRRRLRDLLSELADAGELAWSSSRDRTTRPELPAFVRLATTSTEPRRGVGEGFAWRPELEWAHRLRLTQDEFEVLTAVQAFLRDGGDDIILPHRERSLRLLGHEKRLDRLVSGRLFDPGRLSLSVLGCTWAPPPIAWRPAGGTGPVVVSENAAGFHSALAAFAGRASAVAYGAGTPFSQTAAGLAAIPSINRVVYFGDIDAEGLAIPRRAAAAAEAADVPIPVPATGLWSALADTATQFGEKVEPIPTEVAVELAAWIDEPDLQNRIRSLLEAGIRVPQEALRAEELAACPDPW